MNDMERSEQRALRLVRTAGAALVVLTAVLLAVMPSAPVEQNVPGFTNAVIGFELASEPEHVFGILGRPGVPERPAAVRGMDLGNQVDFAFMVAYAALFAGTALLLAARGAMPRELAVALCVLAATMAVTDALENRQLLALSSMTEPAAMAPALQRLRIFTLLKWYAIFFASAVIAVCAWRDFTWLRWSAPFYALAAACGLVSLGHLPAIEWGSYALAVAWFVTWLHALAPRARA